MLKALPRTYFELILSLSFLIHPISGFGIEIAEIGVAQKNGKANQDRYQAIYDSKTDSVLPYFAIFDGHGSRTSPVAANYSANHLHQKIYSQLGRLKDQSEVLSVLELSFLELDQEICQLTDVGTTAVMVLADLKNSTLHIANSGDSRAVFFQKGKTTQLSVDHIPEGKEAIRVINAGGSVSGKRISGKLAVSRSLGDIEFKWGPSQREDLISTLDPTESIDFDQYIVSPLPHTRSAKLVEGSLQFLILASDGVLGPKSLTNHEAVGIVRRVISKKGTAQTAAELLINYAKGKQDNTDDMTVMVLIFGDQPLLRPLEPRVYVEPTWDDRFEKPVLSYEGYIKNPTRPMKTRKSNSSTSCIIL